MMQESINDDNSYSYPSQNIHGNADIVRTFGPYQFHNLRNSGNQKQNSGEVKNVLHTDTISSNFKNKKQNEKSPVS